MERQQSFVSFDNMVVMLEKHILLNSLFCIIACIAYFLLFAAYFGLICHIFFSSKSLGSDFDYPLLWRMLWTIFEAYSNNQMRYVAY